MQPNQCLSSPFVHLLKKCIIPLWKKWVLDKMSAVTCILLVALHVLSAVPCITSATLHVIYYILRLKNTLKPLTLMVPALFSDACFSLKLKCWRAQISWLFPYTYGEPLYNLSEAPNGLKWGFSAFLLSAGPIFGSENLVFSPFLRLKWQKMISQTQN